jgi:hypothetical protein
VATHLAFVSCVPGAEAPGPLAPRRVPLIPARSIHRSGRNSDTPSARLRGPTPPPEGTFGRAGSEESALRIVTTAPPKRRVRFEPHERATEPRAVRCGTRETNRSSSPAARPKASTRSRPRPSPKRVTLTPRRAARTRGCDPFTPPTRRSAPLVPSEPKLIWHRPCRNAPLSLTRRLARACLALPEPLRAPPSPKTRLRTSRAHGSLGVARRLDFSASHGASPKVCSAAARVRRLAWLPPEPEGSFGWHPNPKVRAPCLGVRKTRPQWRANTLFGRSSEPRPIAVEPESSIATVRCQDLTDRRASPKARSTITLVQRPVWSSPEPEGPFDHHRVHDARGHLAGPKACSVASRV